MTVDMRTAAPRPGQHDAVLARMLLDTQLPVPRSFGPGTGAIRAPRILRRGM